MQKYPIHLNSMEDVTDFVRTVNSFDCDIDLRRGSVIIDAKSFLGVITISGRSDLELVIHSNDCQDVLSAVSSFMNVQKTA